MAHEIGKLTAAKVDQVKKLTGMHADGGGLYLQVKNGGASWVLRFTINGRARYMGLGPLSLFGLKEARAKALDARRLKYQGADPVEARRQERAKQRLDAAKSMTFAEAAERYIASHKAGWRNAKHATQWTNTLNTYAGPTIGAIPVQAIDTSLVLRIVEPLWATKPETAGRLRGRIESILDWATARGFRRGENPARWRGHLDKILPARGKVRSVKHHSALSYADLPAFVATLACQVGVAARSLEFTILTAARTGEALGATWNEIDLNNKVWIVPAERMKAKKEHRVPLSTRAVAILADLKPEVPPPGSFVFPGAKAGKPLSNMAMLMTLRRLGRADLTAHGFRSTFRDWAAERTTFPSEVAEMALAHAVGNKV
ncbi:MAG TPA: integrase arm-type DNA-binding domain-containing protein, partial [Rhizomicrobium sp.]|nr:integrase arm-type DNA-binding domain-containing protein [Rhizomicrobium sp.]